MHLGTMEIVLIVVLALVLFGAGKLSGVGKALGKSIREFKSANKEEEPVNVTEKPQALAARTDDEAGKK